MPAHTITELPAFSPVTVTNAYTRVDPTTGGLANAKRYKVVLINTSATTRVFVGFSTSVTATTGSCIEPDFGEHEFFVDNNVAIYAITASGTATVVAKEYCTA